MAKLRFYFFASCARDSSRWGRTQNTVAWLLFWRGNKINVNAWASSSHILKYFVYFPVKVTCAWIAWVDWRNVQVGNYIVQRVAPWPWTWGLVSTLVWCMVHSLTCSAIGRRVWKHGFIKRGGTLIEKYFESLNRKASYSA